MLNTRNRQTVMNECKPNVNKTPTETTNVSRSCAVKYCLVSQNQLETINRAQPLTSMPVSNRRVSWPSIPPQFLYSSPASVSVRRLRPYQAWALLSQRIAR